MKREREKEEGGGSGVFYYGRDERQKEQAEVRRVEILFSALRESS